MKQFLNKDEVNRIKNKLLAMGCNSNFNISYKPWMTAFNIELNGKYATVPNYSSVEQTEYDRCKAAVISLVIAN